MNPSPDAPVYNLKAVVRETGLKPDTIRAWERRYNLPEPKRTDSGHRLYSQNDVHMLKWLITRQNEGMSISRAVVLWRQLQSDDKTPTFEVVQESAGQSGAVVRESSGPTHPVDRLTQLRESWINSCLHFDEQGAERLLSEAFAIFPVETVCVELLQRGIAQIGDSWHQGRATVQQEHFASALVTRRLEALISATPTPTRTHRILVGCPPGETHTLGAMFLTLWLRRRGWDVLFLGADIPLEDMITTVRMARPQLVILVAQLLHTAATLWEMAQLLGNEQIPLAYGGRIFAELPDLRLRIPGHYLGDLLSQAAPQVENMVALPRTPTAAIKISYEYQDALRHFRSRQAEIEADVWRQLSNLGQADEQLARINAHFSRNLIAALLLGDLNFLHSDLNWLYEMFTGHQKVGEERLAAYLKAYATAVDRQIGNRGALLTQWLQRAFDLNFADSVALSVSNR